MALDLIKRSVMLLFSIVKPSLITFQGVNPSESAETISVKISNSKEDVSTYFNDGQRKVDFVLVSHELTSGDGQGQGSSAVTAAAQAFK